MTIWDWVILALYCVAIVGVGLYFRVRASRGVEEYFIADRKLPWWVIGFSDVAGYTGGGQGYVMLFFLSGFATIWLTAWISWVIWMPLVAILWARWWRRLGVVTTGEFIERRYAGRSASVYRTIYALYACFVWALTSLAHGTAWMATNVSPILGWSPAKVLLVFGALTIAYTIISGLFAVAYNDVLQFVLLMCGNLIFGIYLVSQGGGISEIWRRAAELHGEAFLQPLPSGGLLTPVTIVALCVQGLFFAGSPFAGEGWTAQRYMAARSELHAILGQMLNAALALVVRLIPFILIGLAAAAIYPPSSLSVPAAVWGNLVRERAPAGLFGLLLVGALAGSMASVSAIGNWGASYLMNDIYRRSIRPQGSKREFVMMSRLFSGMLLAAAFTLGGLINPGRLQLWIIFINSALIVFSLPLAWLKWFWWRLNVAGDMVGILGGFPAGFIVWFGSDSVLPAGLRAWIYTHWGLDLNGLVPAFSNLDRFPFWMGFAILFGLGWASILIATLLTPPEPMHVLRKFYLAAKPIGWWRPVRAELSREEAAQLSDDTRKDLKACAWGILFYFTLVVSFFGFIGGHLLQGAAALLVAAPSGFQFVRSALVGSRVKRLGDLHATAK